jgi:hypothetical protein
VNQRYPRSVQVPALLLLAIFAIPAILHAQDVQYSISNEFRYGNGQRFENDLTGRKEYLEDLFNTRFYVGDFTLGFRIQVDKPREYGRDTLGLTQYYAEFNRDGLRARVGTFYNLVGRGMVMNTFESRSLGFNTQSEGIKLNYEMPEFSAGGWGGVMTYADILSSTRVEEYLLRGANATVRPIPEISVGGSYMAASARKTRNGFANAFDAYLREAFVEGHYDAFRAYLNYADKRTQLDSLPRLLTESSEFGTGWYGLLGYTSDMFGITAEYKDYRFDVVKPNEQQSSTRSTRALPFQNPVTLVPEHDKTLLARNPHAIDVNDELGFQVESLIYPTEDMTVTLLAAAASRHNAWTPSQVTDTSGDVEVVYNRINESAPIFPNLSDAEYSPYWEVYAQGEYQVDENLSVIVGLQRRDNIIYHDGEGGDTKPSSEIVKASTLLLESQIGINERDNLHAILETQRMYESKKITPGSDSLGIDAFDGKYMNLLLTLEYSRSPRWSVNTRIEWSSAKNERGGEAFGLGTDVAIWPVIGATYRIGDAHTFGVQYGAERGGVVCTGGVCRLINPFTGFRLSLTSKL